MKINLIYKEGGLVLTSVPGFQHIRHSPPPLHGNELQVWVSWVTVKRQQLSLPKFQSSLNYLFYKVRGGDICVIRQRNRCFELYRVWRLNTMAPWGVVSVDTSVQSSGSPAFPRQTYAEWEILSVWKQMIQVRDIGENNRLINWLRPTTREVSGGVRIWTDNLCFLHRWIFCRRWSRTASSLPAPPPVILGYLLTVCFRFMFSCRKQ